MPAAAPPEIETADLADLALDLASWGARDPSGLRFLTPPPGGPLRCRAQAAVRTRRARRRRGDHAARTGDGGAAAASAARAYGGRRGPWRGAPCRAPVGTAPSARASTSSRGFTTFPRRSEPRRVGSPGGCRRGRGHSPAQMAALAYPDRIGLRRPGGEPRWLLSGGKGVRMAPSDALAAARLIVVTDTDGRGPEPRIRAALEIGEPELREVLGDRIAWTLRCEWSARERRVAARREERLGAVVLEDRPWPDPPPDDGGTGDAGGACRSLGLPWTESRPAAGGAGPGGGPARAARISPKAALLATAEWTGFCPISAGFARADDLARLDLAAILAGAARPRADGGTRPRRAGCLPHPARSARGDRLRR